MVKNRIFCRKSKFLLNNRNFWSKIVIFCARQEFLNSMISREKIGICKKTKIAGNVDVYLSHIINHFKCTFCSIMYSFCTHIAVCTSYQIEERSFNFRDKIQYLRGSDAVFLEGFSISFKILGQKSIFYVTFWLQIFV